MVPSRPTIGSRSSPSPSRRPLRPGSALRIQSSCPSRPVLCPVRGRLRAAAAEADLAGSARERGLEANVRWGTGGTTPQPVPWNFITFDEDDEEPEEPQPEEQTITYDEVSRETKTSGSKTR